MNLKFNVLAGNPVRGPFIIESSEFVIGMQFNIDSIYPETIILLENYLKEKISFLL